MNPVLQRVTTDTDQQIPEFRYSLTPPPIIAVASGLQTAFNRI